MIRRFTIHLLSLLSLLSFMPLFAQLYHIQNYGKEEGLPQLQVFSIHQDSYGFMWFGTGGGLARYDGQEFLYFDRNNGLPDLEIQAMCEDDKKNLWLGTALGLCKVVLKDFNSPVVDSLVVLPNKRIHRIFFDEIAGNLWISIKEEGLYVYRDGQLKKILDIDGSINFITRDSKNYIWTAANNKILKFDENGNLLNQFQIGIDAKPVAIIQDSQGKFLFFSVHEVFEFDAINGELRRSSLNSLINPQMIITEVHVDQNNVFWIGTKNGILKIHNNSAISITTKNGLVGDVINCITEDREGSIWAGTYISGISKILSTSVISYGVKSGLDFNCVNCIRQLRNGTVLVSTNNGIVEFDNYEIKNPAWAKVLKKKDVWALLEDRTGTIWAGTYDGLYRFDKKNNNYFVSNVYLRHRVILTLFEDSKGFIWIGCDGKIYCIKDNQLFQVDEIKDIPIDNIWSINESSDGTMWLTTTTGLIRIKDKEHKFYSEDDGIKGKSVYIVFEDKNKKIWIGTPVGLHQFKNNRFELYDKMEDFRGRSVTDIVSDKEGYMWVCTDKGVNRFDGENVRGKLGKVDGLIGEEFTTDNSAFIDKNGKLWFGVFGGLTIYDPFCEQGKNVPPKIYISRATATDNSMDSAPVLLNQDEEISHRQNILSFKYTGLSFRDELGVHFKCLLDGFDQDWSEWSRNRENRYTNLDPGDYKFRVKSRCSSGIESIEEASFNFSILKPYWQTVWFKSLILLVLISISYVFITRKTRSIKRRNIWLEEKISQRTEELVLAKEYVENIIENAGDIIITVNERGTVLTWNKEAENLFGFSKKEIIGKNIKILDKKGDRISFSELLNMVKRSGPVKQKEIKKRLNDGGEADLLLSVNHLINPFGDRGGYTLVLNDIREKNRLQQALLNREKLLGGIDALQKLLGTLSHYINNSISAISGMAQLSEMDKQFTEKLIDISLNQTTRIKAVLKGLSHLVEELNLKTADYAGEKEVMYDIEDEISLFIKELKENGKKPFPPQNPT